MKCRMNDCDKKAYSVLMCARHKAQYEYSEFFGIQDGEEQYVSISNQDGSCGGLTND